MGQQNIQFTIGFFQSTQLSSGPRQWVFLHALNPNNNSGFPFVSQINALAIWSQLGFPDNCSGLKFSKCKSQSSLLLKRSHDILRWALIKSSWRRLSSRGVYRLLGAPGVYMQQINTSFQVYCDACLYDAQCSYSVCSKCRNESMSLFNLFLKL